MVAPPSSEKDRALALHRAQSSGSLVVDSANKLEEDEDPRLGPHANCLGLDPELFFPARGESTRKAKEVCKGCVIREDCLEYALVNGEKFGIWGGLSERERRRVRKQRAIARRSTPDAAASADGLPL